MIVTKTINNGKITLALEGKLSVTTSSQLHEVIEEALDEGVEVALDFTKLSYISSAGLWVLFVCDNAARSKGSKMVLKNIPRDIMNIICVGGFRETFTFE